MTATPTSPPNSYVLVIRFPTGGIRTHIKYFEKLAPREPGDPQPVLVCPAGSEGEAVADALGLAESSRCFVTSHGIGALTLGVYRACRSNPVHVIQSQGFSSALASFPSTLLLRKRHIITVHDVVTDGVRETTPRIALALLGFVLSRAWAVHAVGDDCATSIRSLPFMRTAKNVVTIRNGIDSNQFRDVIPNNLSDISGVRSDSFKIGFFGRFMAQKGFRTLVDAVALIKSERPSVPLSVIAVGSGGFIREDKEYIRQVGLTNSFHFLDAVEDPAPIMSGVDVVAMPSRWEAYPLLAAEALALGVPLIATTCVGLREVIAGTPARAVPVGDVAALANAIRSEMESPSKVASKAFAPEALQLFDFSQNAGRLRRLLRAAHDGRAPDLRL